MKDIHVRVTNMEYQAIQEAARAENLSLSAFLETAARAYIKKRKTGKWSFEEDLYRASEVARITGSSRGVIESMCRDGKIQAKKIGGLWKIPESEVKRMIGDLAK